MPRKDSVLFDLRYWYIGECRRMGQERLGHRPSRYHHFDNGQPHHPVTPDSLPYSPGLQRLSNRSEPQGSLITAGISGIRAASIWMKQQLMTP